MSVRRKIDLNIGGLFEGRKEQDETEDEDIQDSDEGTAQQRTPE